MKMLSIPVLLPCRVSPDFLFSFGPSAALARETLTTASVTWPSMSCCHGRPLTSDRLTCSQGHPQQLPREQVQGRRDDSPRRRLLTIPLRLLLHSRFLFQKAVSVALVSRSKACVIGCRVSCKLYRPPLRISRRFFGPKL